MIVFIFRELEPQVSNIDTNDLAVPLDGAASDESLAVGALYADAVEKLEASMKHCGLADVKIAALEAKCESLQGLLLKATFSFERIKNHPKYVRHYTGITTNEGIQLPCRLASKMPQFH